jgi:hypothetical protein
MKITKQKRHGFPNAAGCRKRLCEQSGVEPANNQKDAEYADYADERGFIIKYFRVRFYPCTPLNPRIPRPALKSMRH